MGLVYSGAQLITLLLVAVYFAPGLPPHFDFVKFSLPEPLKLQGPLAPNSILDKAQPIKLSSEIGGPESIARRGSDELFTGLRDGRLVKIKNGKVTKIGAFGHNCGPVGSKPTCGRIAGVRFDSHGKLLVADAVNGIFRVDVDTGKSEKIVDMNAPIDGLRPGFPNDLDMDKDGNIYWSDSSTVAQIDNLVLEGLAGPSGRLVKYNAATGASTVLISKIHFANGVQLSPSHDFVLVSEIMGARVWRYYLKGERQGQKDIFVDNLPGLPDNIRPNGRGGYYIVLANPRLDSEVSPLEIIGNWPLTRRFVVRLHHFLVEALSQVEKLFPNVVLKEWVFWIKGFGPLGNLENAPLKTIIVETDGTGKIIGSLQNEKGPITRLSEISIGDEWTYFGSPSLKELYRIKTSELKSKS